MIEKVSGKLAGRPKLNKLLAQLESGDVIVVTRLRRIGLEQGIGTTTPIGRLFFRFIAGLAAFERETIVEGTLEALGIRLGDLRPHVKGKIREYLPL